jgi:hypothetical protein
MTPKEFEQYWKLNYPKSLPIGHHLREAYKDRWFRIHGLPESKRYAETEAEYEEILKRHNAVLSDLLGDNGEYVLLTTGYSTTPTPARSYSQLGTLDGDSKALFSIPKHKLDGETDPYYWHFFMSERTWQPKSADELLKLVADNEISNILFVGVNPGRIYHPYDGGADVILESQSVRNQKRDKYSAWLPRNPHGL